MGSIEVLYHAEMIMTRLMPNRCNRYLGLMIDSNDLSTDPGSLFSLPQLLASSYVHALIQYDKGAHLQTQSQALSLNHR